MKAEWNSSTVVSGRYQIRRLIGRGGAGAVYEAYDPNLSKTVAIKALLGSVQPEQAQRFQMEATATGRLKHRNIVTVMDFGLTETDQMYMVSEFVEGLTLADRLKQSGPLSPDEFLSVMTQICEAMEHAHDVGIVHRDLKPENIILVSGEDGMLVKIVDFGIAKIVDLDGSLTRTGVSLGSPYYMSPEQVTAGNIDHRSDIYSLGAVMFHCLEGRPPFRGDSSIATMRMHTDEPFPSLTKMDSDTEYGEAIEKIISGCTAKDPNRRIKSMSEVLEMLNSVEYNGEADFGSKIHGDGSGDSVSPGSAKSADQSRRGFVIRAAAAALALVTVAVVVFVGVIEPNFLKPVPVSKLPDESESQTTMIALKSLDKSMTPDGFFLNTKEKGPKSLSGERKFATTGGESWTNVVDVSASI